MVSRLQADNQRLSLNQKQESSHHQDDNSGLNSFDAEIIQKFRNQIEEQRNEMREQNKMLQERDRDIDANMAQMEILKHQAFEARKRSKLLNCQVKTLCDERADFLAKIQDQQMSIISLKKKVIFTCLL